MRFRTKVFEISCIHELIKVVSTVAKLVNKTGILRLCKDKMYFISTDRAMSGMQVWVCLQQAKFFDEYSLEGVSNEANEIYLDLAPDNLMRALRSAHNAKSIKIKLAKKHVPCLTVDIDLPSRGLSTRSLVHDVPVHVVSRRLWKDYEEPAMPACQVSVELPVLKTLKTILEKMKNISHIVTVSANNSGQFNIKVETDLVTVTTYYRHLAMPNLFLRGDREPDTEKFFSVRVDIKKFALFCSSQHILPQRVICNIADKKMLHLYFTHPCTTIQCFLPVTTAS